MLECIGNIGLLPLTILLQQLSKIRKDTYLIIMTMRQCSLSVPTFAYSLMSTNKYPYY